MDSDHLGNMSESFMVIKALYLSITQNTRQALYRSILPLDFLLILETQFHRRAFLPEEREVKVQVLLSSRASISLCMVARQRMSNGLGKTRKFSVNIYGSYKFFVCGRELMMTGAIVGNMINTHI